MRFARDTTVVLLARRPAEEPSVLAMDPAARKCPNFVCLGSHVDVATTRKRATRAFLRFLS